jgi:hypothetical protein
LHVSPAPAICLITNASNDVMIIVFCIHFGGCQVYTYII